MENILRSLKPNPQENYVSTQYVYKLVLDPGCNMSESVT